MLARIEREVFASCLSLKSICIPASVEIIDCDCFASCSSLADLTFECGSRMTQIAGRAFDRCSSLQSICIPASLQILSELFLKSCTSMSTLTFAEPSKLRIVSILPPTSLCFIHIPDSIEFLRCYLDVETPGHCVLHFGIKSNLHGISLPSNHFTQNRPRTSNNPPRHRAFTRLSEFSLKGFRSTFELYDGHLEDDIFFSDSVSQIADWQRRDRHIFFLSCSGEIWIYTWAQAHWRASDCRPASSWLWSASCSSS
jgi:hypothetical protein